MMHIKQSVLVSSALTVAIVVASLTPGPSAAQGQLNPQHERIGPTSIHADHEAYKAVQGRIKALNDRGIQVDDYALSKAQCWLDTSFHEYTRNDRGGYPQAALDESLKIVGALEAGVASDPSTPLVNGAQKLRDDLWARFEALKKATGFACAAKKVACGEVELVHAGNEIGDGGWRHANPYIQIAEDALAEAEAVAAACPTAPVAVSTEHFSLEADALFVFDRGDVAGLKPEGKVKLDQLSDRLRDVYVSVEGIKVEGHTDRLGSQAYNQRLSLQRARTVQQYLQQRGVAAPIDAQGRGESDPVSVGCAGDTKTPSLVQCLQPDRRVSVDVTGVLRSK